MNPIPARPALLLWLVFALYCGYLGWAHLDGRRAAASGGTPLFTDFTPTYAGALLLRERPAEDLYRPKLMFAAELEAARAAYDHRISDAQAHGVGYAPWMYPPSFLLFVAPLGYLPYLPAFAAWIAATLLPYLLAMRRILQAPWALPAALAAPPVFYNLMYGQTGFLSAGLIALGLLNLRTRPNLAGALIGLASVKPHLGLLIPFALAAGGYWRAFAVAGATVAGSIALSIRLFGADPWYGFLGTLQFHAQGLQAGAYAWKAMATLLSVLKLGGMDLDPAWRLQYALAGAMLVAVSWNWWRHRGDPAKFGLLCALLCTGTLLALPLAYLYDLVLLVPAAGWLWADLDPAERRGWPAVAVLAAVGASLPVRLLPPFAGIALVVAGEFLLLALILQRLRRGAGSPDGTG